MAKNISVMFEVIGFLLVFRENGGFKKQLQKEMVLQNSQTELAASSPFTLSVLKWQPIVV